MIIFLILFKILKLYENKVQNQSSLFSEDNQKISYLIQDKKNSNWTNDRNFI